MSIQARSRVKHATIHSNGQYLTTGLDYSESDDLSPGQTLDLGTAGDSEAGQLIYSRPNGQTLTIDFLSEEDIYGKSKCAFVGTDDLAGRKSRNGVYYAKDATSPKRRVFRRNGVKLTGQCAGGPTLMATVLFKDSSGLLESLVEQFAASPGASFSGGAGISGGSAIGGFLGADADAGQVVVARDSNRSVVSIEYLAETADGHGGRDDCLLAGTARVLKPKK